MTIKMITSSVVRLCVISCLVILQAASIEAQTTVAAPSPAPSPSPSPSPAPGPSPSPSPAPGPYVDPLIGGAYNCSFDCLHSGSCTYLGICSCPIEWTGVDCSISTDSMLQKFNYTENLSFIGADYSKWDIQGSPDNNSFPYRGYRAIHLEPTGSMWTKQGIIAKTFKVSVSMRLYQPNQGATIFFSSAANKSPFSGDAYGYNWLNFRGIAIKIEPSCPSSIFQVAHRPDNNNVAESCDEFPAFMLGFDTSLLVKTFELSISFTDGILSNIDICTGGTVTCQGLFTQADLGAVTTLSSVPEFNVGLMSIGVAAGLNTPIDVFEVRFQEDYVRQLSYTYDSASMVVTYSSTPISQTGGFRLLTDGTSLSPTVGTVWNQQDSFIEAFRFTAIVEVILGTNEIDGIAVIWTVPAAIATSPSAIAYGLQSLASFQGVFLKISATSPGYACLNIISGTLGTACNSVTPGYVNFTDSIRGSKMRIEMGFQSGNLAVSLCRLSYPCQQLFTSVPLTGAVIAALTNSSRIGISAMVPTGGSQDVVRVHDMRIESRATSCSGGCKNNGYCKSGGQCICLPNYSGTKCETPSCGVPVSHGYCSAYNIFTCYDGWAGKDCSLAVCTPLCGLHSFCTSSSPRNCTCISGWTGSDCNSNPNSPKEGASMNTFVTLQQNYSIIGGNTISWDRDLEWGLALTAGYQISGAIRLLQPIFQKRGGIWTKMGINMMNYTIVGTFEMVNYGSTGTAFAIILSPNTSISRGPGYDNAFPYSMKISNFQGAAFIFDPSIAKFCGVINPTPSIADVTCSNPSNSISVSTSYLYSKIEVTIEVTNNNQFNVLFCTYLQCYNKLFSGISITNPVNLGVVADNPSVAVGYVDIFDLRTYSITKCSTCTANQVCSQSGSCICQDGWTGASCTTALCPNAPISPHINCVSPYTWSCAPGYSGPQCLDLICFYICSKNSYCIVPNGACTCLAGWTGPNCETQISTDTLYWPILIPSASYYNQTSLPNFIRRWPNGQIAAMTPDSSGMRLASSFGNENRMGWIRSIQTLPKDTDFAINATLQIQPSEKPVFIFLGTLGSFLDPLIYGNYSNEVINFQEFQGIIFAIFSNSSEICIAYAPINTHSNKNCMVIGSVTVDMRQKLRYGIVISKGRFVNIDVCSTSACQHVFVQQNFTEVNPLHQIPDDLYLGAGAPANDFQFQAFDIYELSITQIPMCSINCMNGGKCTSTNTCTCASGWTGRNCMNAVCNTPCAPNEFCVAPDVCNCLQEWYHGYCMDAIPVPTNQGSPLVATVDYVDLPAVSFADYVSSSGMFDGYPAALRSSGASVIMADSVSSCNSIVSKSLLDVGGNYEIHAVVDVSMFSKEAMFGFYLATDASFARPVAGVISDTVDWPNFQGLAMTFIIPTTQAFYKFQGTIDAGATCCGSTGGRNATLRGKLYILIKTEHGNIISAFVGSSTSHTEMIYGYSFVGDIANASTLNLKVGFGACINPTNTEYIRLDRLLVYKTPHCSPLCDHGGTCLIGNNCNCAAGWTGTSCNTPVCATPCVNGGTCSSPNVCTCLTGYSGSTCETINCAPSCMNGGTCSAPNFCTCATGWTGSNCNTSAAFTCTSGCSGNGACIAAETCNCIPGWTGATCNTPTCTPSCANGGSCASPNTCSCPSGWGGPSCSTQTCTPSCANGGLCTGPNTCSCLPGWTGQSCTTAICNTPCQNGGTCSSPNFCTCPLTYTDATCSTPVCSPSCSNGGICASPQVCNCPMGWSGSSCTEPVCNVTCLNGGSCTGPNTCSCASGWAGATCTTASCSPTCQHGGACTGVNFCSCPTGWMSSDCSISTNAVCTPACSSHGTCVGTNQCACAAGWAGPTCSSAICPSGCANGGICSSPNTCTCTTGWTGPTCIKPLCSSCVFGTCYLPELCQCNSDYTGSSCNIPICVPACANGVCSSPNTCTCNTGWTGSLCDKATCSPVCYNGGTCVAPNTCTCVSGYTGTGCLTTTCVDRPCVQGTCVGANLCSCNAGYTGSTCSNATCSSACIHGRCTSPNVCTCDSGWSGSTCTTAQCLSACNNGGLCSAPNTCTCTSGWQGATCLIPVCSPICSNGGTCVSPNNCQCTTGWTGTGCNTPICSPSCVHGTCSAPNTCQCQFGWGGSTCSIPVCSNGCGHGTCTGPNTCTCNFGWAGSTCSDAICSPTCQHGTCTSPGQCTCSFGWTGASCSVAICDFVCNHGGSCTAPNQCSCAGGYFGSDCSQFTCTSSCKNGGTCIGPDSCRCSTKWTGPSCESAICTTPCQNGATCSSPDKCTCKPGFDGGACEHSLCSVSCKNGGNCVGVETCSCLAGFTGTYCDKILSSGSGASVAGTILNSLSGLGDSDLLSNIDLVKQVLQPSMSSKSLASSTTQAQLVATSMATYGSNSNNGNAAANSAKINTITTTSKMPPLLLAALEDEKPKPVLSPENVQQQAAIVSGISAMMNRLSQLDSASITSDKVANVVEVLQKAVDNATYVAVKAALDTQTALAQQSQYGPSTKLPCDPFTWINAEKPIQSSDAIAQLKELQTNFDRFLNGLIASLLKMNREVGTTKTFSGDFYSALVYKTRISDLSGLKLSTEQGGVAFPSVVSEKLGSMLKYKKRSNNAPELSASSIVTVFVTTLVSNVLDWNNPFNFPTVTVKVFAENQDEVEWNGSDQIVVSSIPQVYLGERYSQEYVEAQCDDSTKACNAQTNADSLGTLATYPLSSTAGDFLLLIARDSFPFSVYLSFKELPTNTKYTWRVTVTDTTALISTNDNYATPRVGYSSTSQLRLIIPGSAIYKASGSTSEKQTTLTLHVFLKRDLSKYGKLDDLPPSTCALLKCNGAQVFVHNMATQKSRRRRDAILATAEDNTTAVELTLDSTTTGVAFKSNYFGSFGTDLLIMPNTIAFSDIFANFSDLIADNSAVFSFIIAVILIFILTAIIMNHFDKSDLKDWAFLPITSNSNHENMRYLISVHCNGAKNYRLGPKVDIRLFGNVICTEWRNLNDGLRKNFTGGHPSNFLLTTYHTIGVIESIELSVSSESSDPKDELQLDIDRVIVVDAVKGKKYVFLVKSKMRAGTTKKFKLANEDEIKGFTYLLTGHSRFTVKEAHPWLSVIKRPLPSNWTRCERLACIVSAVFLAMLVNAMFYGKESASPRLGVRVGDFFRISWFTFWTSLVSCLIVLPPITAMSLLFQLVKRRSAEKSNWATIFNIKVKDVYDDEDEDDEETTHEKLYESNKQKAKKAWWQLPFFFIYIAWFLVAVCIGVSGFMVIMYSLSWGQEKSLQWLSSMFMHVLQDVLIIQSLKVAALALINSTRLSLPDDGLPVGKLTYPSYNSTRRVELFKKLRSLITGMGLHIVFVAIYAAVISTTRNDSAYIQVQNIRKLVYMHGYKVVSDPIPDYSRIFDHLQYKVIPNFLGGNQLRYGLNFPDSQFYNVPNHDVVIIGAIRLRQQRSGSEPCQIKLAPVQAYIDRYSGPLTVGRYSCQTPQVNALGYGDTSEQRTFNGTWTNPVDTLGSQPTSYQTAWTFRDTEGPAYIGEAATYQTSGYYIDLPTKLADAFRTMEQLRQNRWLDTNTTVVFVDFILFNPQVNLFVPVKIVYESLRTGGMLYQPRIYALQLYQYTGADSILVVIMQVIWLILLISFIVKMALRLKQEGFKAFRRNYWNLLEVFQLVIGVIIIGLFFARIIVIISTVEVMRNQPNTYMNLDLLASWEEMMNGLYGLGFFLTMMGFFRYLAVNKYWAIFLGTLSKGRYDLISYTALFIIVSSGSAAFFYLIVGDSMFPFRTYRASFLTLVQRIIGSTSSSMTKLGFHDKFSMSCSMIYSTIVLFIGAQIFTTIINRTYATVNSHIERDTAWDSKLAEYIVQEWRRMIAKAPANENSLSSEDGANTELRYRPIKARTYKKLDDRVDRFSELMDALNADDDFEVPVNKERSSSKVGPGKGDFFNKMLAMAGSKEKKNISNRMASHVRSSYIVARPGSSASGSDDGYASSVASVVDVSQSTPVEKADSASGKRSGYMKRRESVAVLSEQPVLQPIPPQTDGQHGESKQVPISVRKNNKDK